MLKGGCNNVAYTLPERAEPARRPPAGAGVAIGPEQSRPRAVWRCSYRFAMAVAVRDSTVGIYKQVPPPSAPGSDGLVTVTVRGNLTPVVVPDSVLEFNYRNEYDITDAPIQDG